jgi:SAM-dependent MidA family methyltransferase
VEQNQRKIQVGNEMVDAIPIRIRSSNEHWSEFFVDDGTLLRVKLIATEAFRVVDRHDADGNPLYVLRTHNVMTVQSPDNLRRKP